MKFKKMFLIHLILPAVLGLICSSAAQDEGDDAGSFRGLTFGERVDEVCLAPPAMIELAEQFSFCAFVRLAGPAQDASLLRLHTPEGGVVEAGTMSNGAFLRVKPKHRSSSPQHERSSPQHERSSPQHERSSPQHERSSPQHERSSPQRERRSPSTFLVNSNFTTDELNIVIHKSKGSRKQNEGSSSSSSNQFGENDIGLTIDDGQFRYLRQPSGNWNTYLREDEEIKQFHFEFSDQNQTLMADDVFHHGPLDLNEDKYPSKMNETDIVRTNDSISFEHGIYKTESGLERNFSLLERNLSNESSSPEVTPNGTGILESTPTQELLPSLNDLDYGDSSSGSGDSGYFTDSPEESDVFESDMALTLFVFEATLSPSTWHHLCLSYDEVTNTASCQVDGTEEQISFSKEEFISSLQEIQISENSSVCIGSENFYGDLTGLEIFRTPLELQKGETYYPCQNGSFPSAIADITMSSPWILPENTSFSEFYKPDVCGEESFQNIVLYKVGGYHKTLQYCRSLGGHLPSLEEVSLDTVEIIQKNEVDDVKNINYISWLSTNHTTKKRSSFNCHALTSDFTETEISCVRSLRVSICVTKRHRVTLYGHQGTHFDHFFHLEVENGEIKWTGLQQSFIGRNSSSWILESPFHSSKMFLFNKTLPIGRHEWVSTMSPNVSNTLLTLSLCKTFEFSCNDGSCLPIAQRCDDVFHCEDNSDEVNCDVLNLPNSYKKFYEPPPRPGEIVPSTLYYDVEVYHLGTITTDEGKASMDVAVSVAWFDPRLDFTNLKVGKKNYFDCAKIWKPSIRTLTGNGDGSVVKTNFYEEQCYTTSLNQHPSRNLTDPWMGHSASGLKYPLQYHIGLRTTVPCDFYLVRYPFDRQVCNVSFMVMNAPGSRIFGRSKEGVLVRYLNKKRLLLEYELVNLTTESSTSMQGMDNNSYFLVSYHMERLYGYHIMNSFFPSLLMALVSYSTFYYKINDFYDRILVSLTAHFILASQFIAVTNSSTKTPYLKLIDVWYAVIMTYCFTIIIVQVAINVLMHCQKFPDWLRDRFKMLRFSSSRVAPVAGNPLLDGTLHAGKAAAAHSSSVTPRASRTPRRMSRLSGSVFPEPSIPEVNDSMLSPMDALDHTQSKWSTDEEDDLETLELDEVLHMQAQEHLYNAYKRNSIMALTKFTTRLPVAKILAVASLRTTQESQAKQNLNKIGPAVASAQLANFIAKILMLAFILGLLISYFMVVTKFLE